MHSSASISKALNKMQNELRNTKTVHLQCQQSHRRKDALAQKKNTKEQQQNTINWRDKRKAFSLYFCRKKLIFYFTFEICLYQFNLTLSCMFFIFISTNMKSITLSQLKGERKASSGISKIVYPWKFLSPPIARLFPITAVPYIDAMGLGRRQNLLYWLPWWC